jgi:uncharacterized delta-60 repeat protein
MPDMAGLLQLDRNGVQRARTVGLRAVAGVTQLVRTDNTPAGRQVNLKPNRTPGVYMEPDLRGLGLTAGRYPGCYGQVYANNAQARRLVDMRRQKSVAGLGIVVGGTFNTVAGTTRNDVCNLSPSGALKRLDPNSNGNVYAVKVSGKSVYVGGTFTEIGGQSGIQKLVRLTLSGAVDTGFDPSATVDFTVWKIVIQPDGKIIVCGGENTGRVERLNDDGTADEDFTPIVFGERVYDVELSPAGKLLVAGRGWYNTNVRRQVARFNADGSFDSGFEVDIDFLGVATCDDVMYDDDGNIWMVGHGSYPLSKLDPNGAIIGANYGSDGLLNVGVATGNICFYQPTGGNIYIGGKFEWFEGASSYERGIERIQKTPDDGEIIRDTAFTCTLGEQGASFPLQHMDGVNDDDLMIGGTFGTINGTAMKNMAVVDNTGALVTDFANPDINATVYSFDQ